MGSFVSWERGGWADHGPGFYTKAAHCPPDVEVGCDRLASRVNLPRVGGHVVGDEL